MKKRVLIIAPIADFGARELEMGYIASLLGKQYDITVCSTGNLANNSQVFDFINNSHVFSINQLIFKHYFLIRLVSFIYYFRNFGENTPSFYVKNRISKKHLQIEKKIEKKIENLINNYDLIFIVAQLSSAHMKKLVEYSYSRSIPVIFRTTGAIASYQNLKKEQVSWLQKVYLYINHSNANSDKLFFLKNYKFSIIDQCAFNEEKLLQIPFANIKVKNFLTLGRLVKEKNVDVVIKAFQKSKTDGDKLYVVGDGPELENLIKIAGSDKDIYFTGFVSNKEISKLFSIVQCVVVSYYELETGPLTGIEAMASGRLIISSKTGAMEERLPFNKYWFDNDVNSLSDQITKVKMLELDDVKYLSRRIRNRYNEEYSKNKIGGEYLRIVNEILNKCE